jgi:HEAT repeat protein
MSFFQRLLGGSSEDPAKDGEAARDPSLQKELRRLERELQNFEPEPRRAAMEKLAQMGSRGAADVLVRYLDAELVNISERNPGNVRPYQLDADATGVLKALAGMGAVAAEALLAFLHAMPVEDPALHSIPPHHLSRTYTPGGSRNENMQSAVEWVLLRMGEPAVEALAAALSIPALPDVQSGASAENLRLHLERKRREEEWEALASVLATIGGPRVPPVLRALLQDQTQDPSRRTLVMKLLSKIRSPNVVDSLSATLEDRDARLRERAASALGEMDLPETAAPLIAALTDVTEAVRESAAAALGKLGSPEAVEPLLAVLQDAEEEPAARGAAALALSRIGDPRATEPLARIALDADGESGVRLAAALALSRIGDTRAIEPLVDLAWGEEDASGTVSALSSLLEMHATEATPEALKAVMKLDGLQRSAFPMSEHERYQEIMEDVDCSEIHRLAGEELARRTTARRAAARRERKSRSTP